MPSRWNVCLHCKTIAFTLLFTSKSFSFSFVVHFTPVMCYTFPVICLDFLLYYYTIIHRPLDLEQVFSNAHLTWWIFVIQVSLGFLHPVRRYHITHNSGLTDSPKTWYCLTTFFWWRHNMEWRCLVLLLIGLLCNYTGLCINGTLPVHWAQFESRLITTDGFCTDAVCGSNVTDLRVVNFYWWT